MDNNLTTKFITSCRLKPIALFEGTFKDNKLETYWVDEFGNSIFLNRPSPQITKKDPKIKHNTQISTDLFGNRSILETARISKSVTMISHYLFFYGTDEYFRCFDINSGKRVSPLEIGSPDLLFTMIRYADHKYKNINPGFIIYGLPSAEIETILIEEYTRYE